VILTALIKQYNVKFTMFSTAPIKHLSRSHCSPCFFIWWYWRSQGAS